MPVNVATEQHARDVPATVSTSQHTHTLPTGTRLFEFELTETLGEGGFGVVYLAWDHSLDRRVALKEYMPSAIAFRVGNTEIRPRSERHQETFQAGLKSFINEAKLLAQFDHPALVKVYRFWEANGTAYMVMPFYEGVTVREVVRGFAQPPDEAWIRALLEPLFHALSMLHAAQCYHRDIAPDNVLLLAENGRPLLLDFGAARRVIGDMTQALTAILKPGYAPIEQYAEVPGLKQGAWTDVYALAAVVHWIITGKTPPASVGRMFGDSHVPLAETAAGRYSPQFLQAVDRALAVLPVNRTQTIEALRQDMASPAGGAAPAPPPLPERQRTIAPPPRTAGPVTPATRGPPTQATVPVSRREPAAALEAPPPRSWLLPLALGSLALVVAAISGYVLLQRSSSPPSEPPASTQPLARDTLATVPAPETRPAAQTAPPVVQTAPPADAAPAIATQTPEVAASAVVVRKVDPEPTVRKPPPAKLERRVEPTAAEPRVTTDNQAECARLFQRLSIGESHPEIIERVKALRCR